MVIAAAGASPAAPRRRARAHRGQLGKTPLIALEDRDYRSALRRCRDARIGGGTVYDALIAACALKARVKTLVTWDLEGFERFLEDEPAMRAPGAR